MTLFHTIPLPTSIRVIIITIVGTICHSLAAFFPITIDSEWTIYEQVTMPGLIFYFISLATPIIAIILIRRNLIFRFLTAYSIVISLVGIVLIGFISLVGGHTPFLGFYGFVAALVLFLAANIFYNYPSVKKIEKHTPEKDTLIRTSKHASLDKVFFCPHCKTIIEKTDTICNNCGKEIKK
ncbi:MAG: zinc ribbon domain-containing protein [Candidatus Thorarchaeota archaeon]